MNTAPDNNDELRELYRELILDHARNPRHFGKLNDATHCAEGINPLCGDKITIYLRLDDDDIKDIAFEGTGCAIAMTSASIMTENIMGKSLQAANAEVDRVIEQFRGPAADRQDFQLRLEALRAAAGAHFEARVGSSVFEELDQRDVEELGKLGYVEGK